jgi:hypothetical protein
MSTMSPITLRTVSGSTLDAEASTLKQRPDNAELAQKLLAARREARLASPAASEQLKAFCAELDLLKDKLATAIREPGHPQEWGAPLDAVRSSIPVEHGSLGLAFAKAMALAEESAAKGDRPAYLLGLRRLWTAFSMLQLTLSL